MGNTEPPLSAFEGCIEVVSNVEDPFAHLSERKKKFILKMEDDFRSTDRPLALLQFADVKTFNRATEIAGILITRGWDVALDKAGYIVDISSNWDA